MVGRQRTGAWCLRPVPSEMATAVGKPGNGGKEGKKCALRCDHEPFSRDWIFREVEGRASTSTSSHFLKLFSRHIVSNGADSQRMKEESFFGQPCCK